MRAWVGALGAFIAGTGLGIIYSSVTIEAKVRREYEESAEMRERAYDLAEMYAQDEAEPEEGDEQKAVLTIGSTEITQDVFTGEGVLYSPLEKNPYHTPPQILDEQGVEKELELILYIDEEEYIDEDGRAKCQLTFVGGGTEVHFFEEGVQIDDWKERLGESFLVDFNRLIPYGGESVLYVRNVKTDIDYEVIREMP